MKTLTAISLIALSVTPALALTTPDNIQRQQQQLMEAQIRAQEIENIAAASPYATGKQWNFNRERTKNG